jgi:hypothetical protein
MSKPLYDSPDVSLIDYTNTQSRNSGPRPYIIDSRELAPKAVKENYAKKILSDLEGVVREEDIKKMLAGTEDTGSEPTINKVLAYLEKNIPGVEKYTEGLGKEATEEEKIAAIKKGLEERSEAIEEYNNREICEAPYLGNEVEEARGKQEGPDVAKRFKSQYEMVPGVRGRENRGAVKSYKVLVI